MSPEERARIACDKLTIDWGHDGSWQAGYVQGWQDAKADAVPVRGVLPADGSTIRLIPPGTTHMQYGRERRMAIAEYLDSLHYDAPGWVPVRRTFRQDAPGTMSVRPLGSDVQWFIWTPKGWA